MTRKGHKNPLEGTPYTAYYNIWPRNFVPVVRSVPAEVRISVLQPWAQYDIIIKGQKRSQLPFVSSITDHSCELLLLSKEAKTLTIPFYLQSKQQALISNKFPIVFSL